MHKRRASLTFKFWPQDRCKKDELLFLTSQRKVILWKYCSKTVLHDYTYDRQTTPKNDKLCKNPAFLEYRTLPVYYFF